MVLTLDLLSRIDRLISVYSTIQSEALQSSTKPIVPSDEDRRSFEDYLKWLAAQRELVENHTYDELVVRMSQIDHRRYQCALMHFIYWRNHLSETELMTRMARILYDCFYINQWNDLLSCPWFIPEWRMWHGWHGGIIPRFDPIPSRSGIFHEGRGLPHGRGGFGHR